ncbi:MAG: hypothetical protein AUJ92_11265 [Armatimonadetes bacterium CG2_30_59_28]|nr:MAG: hypothetical protein AUJ92_11265 [Armatimonadetes bacterium CG2_30_59_28]
MDRRKAQRFLIAAVLMLSVAVNFNGVAANPIHAPLEKDITAEGEAAIGVSGKTAARDAALAQALCNAILQVAGGYVESKTEVINMALKESYTKLITDGFASVDKVLAENDRGDTYWVKIKAIVTPKPLAEKLKAKRLLREWKIMVVIPEQHLSRPNIPDPAAETQVIGCLVRAGFFVVDQSQYERIRYDRQVRLAAKGDIEAACAIGKQYGCDIIIVGEAFTQMIGRWPTSAGVDVVACRGRLEYRAVRVDTAEIVSAGDLHETGRDATEELASKVALSEAGKSISPAIITDLLLLPGSSTRHVQLKISGLKKASDAQRLEKALRDLPGVEKVTRFRYDNGVDIVDLTVSAATSENLAALIEEHPSLDGFQIEVSSDSKSRIIARCRY